MTYLHDDPKDFPATAVAGLVAAHPEELQSVHGGVVRKRQTPQGQPALVVGGGSGHYPAFAGWVGPGIAHGAPCGNLFASPSSDQVYSVARNAENGGGVLLGFGNYAGDVLHFGVAAEKLRAEGIDVRIARVSDDVASNAPERHADRRGIAGDFPVFKILGAALQEGADIDEAERIAGKANDATRSLGVAFDGCTMPGAGEALFHVPDGRMAIGLGIHGEPGIEEVDMMSSRELAALLVDGVLAERPAGHTGRVAPLLNGLGTVKYEEMFVVWNHAAALLEDAGLTLVRPEVGEFVTSLDMAGLSLTLTFLDDELEHFWTAPADTPAYRRGGTVQGDLGAERTAALYVPGDDPIPDATAESRSSAARIVAVLTEIGALLQAEEAELGRLDAVAGDGDHGSGMVLGSRAAVRAGTDVLDRGAGARTVLVQAGAAWSAGAGGTSGALWGAALTATGRTFSDSEKVSDEQIRAGLVAAVGAVERLGGAAPGDKTMVDAALPFRESLESATGGGAAAVDAAERTSDIPARLGRARVLGEKSLGTPDPGAVSFAKIASRLGELLPQ